MGPSLATKGGAMGLCVCSPDRRNVCRWRDGGRRMPVGGGGASAVPGAAVPPPLVSNECRAPINTAIWAKFLGFDELGTGFRSGSHVTPVPEVGVRGGAETIRH
eukprot:CAMPEP_0174360854 /NCGR_PEP_ID=MMETSP0811_2-20130205/56395_1 /TAXON_ID=73025 ORGANISM="Eutreptiella gymnastica-like, Strain CCMP1594" /NCGR_SAMPLE_ID=MMETSP0811_2 /ASSEMBLY_ACC=CAM_ASM_000667 /LENGTH=103 /DNA_ID=CAMNT_0015497021 /DNA_START=151 /DNA_END=463 /DNA_ORIENTATION=-